MNEPKPQTIGELRQSLRVLKRAIKKQETLRKLKEQERRLTTRLDDLRDFNQGRIDSLD